MKPNVEKICGVWEKEPGLCYGALLERDGGRDVGCAIGSLLWASPHYGTGPERLKRISAAFSAEGVDETVAVLTAEYGMDKEDMRAVTNWNDDFALKGAPLDTAGVMAARRDHMIAKVREEWGEGASDG